MPGLFVAFDFNAGKDREYAPQFDLIIFNHFNLSVVIPVLSFGNIYFQEGFTILHLKNQHIPNH